MNISKDQHNLLRKIDENDFKAFLGDSLGKGYKNHLDFLYINFNEELKRCGIPNQSQLMLIISEYGPYSSKIDKHIRQNSNLVGENQRNQLRQCFVKAFLSNQNWKNDKGQSWLFLFEQFQNKKLQNTIPKCLENMDNLQQSNLLQQFDSIENNNDSFQKSNGQNMSSADIFVSMIRDDTHSYSQNMFVSMIRDDPHSNDDYVYIPKKSSSIENCSKKRKSAQVQDIALENLTKQSLNIYAKKIRQEKSLLQAKQVNQANHSQKSYKNSGSLFDTNQKPQMLFIQTPFQPDPNDNQPQAHPVPDGKDQGVEKGLVNQAQKSQSNHNGSQMFESIINYPSLPEVDNVDKNKRIMVENSGLYPQQQFNSQNLYNGQSNANYPSHQHQRFSYPSLYPQFPSPPDIANYANLLNLMTHPFGQNPISNHLMNQIPFPHNYQPKSYQQINQKYNQKYNNTKIEQIKQECIQIPKPQNFPNSKAKNSNKTKPIKESQNCHNILHQITKYHQKLLKQYNSADQNKNIAQDLYQKYKNKIFNDFNCFQIPFQIENWLNSLKPEQYLSVYSSQTKTKFIQMNPIQPRFPLVLPTLYTELLNQERFYLSIFQFYQIFQKSSQIYLHFDSLNQFINAKEIIKRTKQDLKKNQRFTILAGLMAADLQIIGAEINFRNMQTFICDYFYKQYRPLKESLSLNDPILSINLKSTQNQFNIFRFLTKDNQSTSKELQVISNQKLLCLFNLRQKNYTSYQKNLPSKIGQLKKMAYQIVSQTIKAQIDNYSSELEEIRVKIVKNLIKQIFKDFIKLGLIPKNMRFQPQSSPFVDIPEYEIQPISLSENESFQSILEDLSPLIDKQRIFEKVMSKTYQQKSQKIAYTHEYIMQVKKEFKNIEALSFYAMKKSSKFQEQLKNKQFMNFILYSIKFEKLLQRFVSSIQRYPHKMNENELLNYGYETMVDELNRLEMELNIFSLSLSIQSKVWFHKFAIGYLIKCIVSMAELRNQIRKQMAEQLMLKEKSLLDQLIKGANQKEK